MHFNTNDVEGEKAIRAIVKTSIESYANGFETRHISEYDNPDGVINMKIHNVFIASLGPEIQYYSALSRSLDSSLGNMLEKMAINIAGLFYEVTQSVEGEIYATQISKIAEILEKYKSHQMKPIISDYVTLINEKNGNSHEKRHISDYYLYDKETDQHHLIELKIGGDLDNKKARSEKEAILEQYAILANNLGRCDNIFVHFATGYNRYGENMPWRQERVRQFFADDELMIGKDFWNFVSKSENGYRIVLDEYNNNSFLIVNALNNIKRKYLGA